MATRRTTALPFRLRTLRRSSPLNLSFSRFLKARVPRLPVIARKLTTLPFVCLAKPAMASRCFRAKSAVVAAASGTKTLLPALLLFLRLSLVVVVVVPCAFLLSPSLHPRRQTLIHQLL